ncbi:MAG: prolyl-tRNA synthetase associated domain-containing protein [Gemmatimonadetes bacterium]|nr:prolyl-tRNA synthetase associated domain-containing protein [Gemmatimonadota bacterium]
MPARAENLFRRLAELGIEITTVHHPPVFTVEEAKALRGEIPGAHTKNLFLRDKRGSMWLLVCLEDRRLDLRELAGRLDTSKLSFANPERLMKYLGVTAGAVTPFAVINDKGRQVEVVLDRALREKELLNFHPLDNCRTSSIGTEDFLRFLREEGHPPRFLDFE